MPMSPINFGPLHLETETADAPIRRRVQPWGAAVASVFHLLTVAEIAIESHFLRYAVGNLPSVLSSSINCFASIKSVVSNPSVNQP